MDSQKPAVIIVSGAWHTPASYAKLATALEAAGYEVHCPRNPSTSEVRPPTAGRDEDVAGVRSVAQKLIDGGREVIAVMHSYGGAVGTEAFYDLGLEARQKEGLSGGVSDLIYMCAYAMPEGTSTSTKTEEMGHTHLISVLYDIAEDFTVVPRDFKAYLLGEDAGIDEADAYVATLERWNLACGVTPMARCAWRQIPVTYIQALRDTALPIEYQRSFVEGMEAAGRKVRLFELDTGHCPNLTATADVVDIVNQVAGQKP